MGSSQLGGTVRALGLQAPVTVSASSAPYSTVVALLCLEGASKQVLERVEPVGVFGPVQVTDWGVQPSQAISRAEGPGSLRSALGLAARGRELTGSCSSDVAWALALTLVHSGAAAAGFSGVRVWYLVDGRESSTQIDVPVDVRADLSVDGA